MGSAIKDQVQGQEVGSATKGWQDQLSEQETGGETQEDHFRDYTLVESSQDLWALDLIADTVGIKKPKDFK